MKNYANVKSTLSLVTVAVVLCLFMGAASEDSGSRPKAGRLSKTSGAPLSTMLNINRVAAWYSSDGEQERDPSTGNSGLFYPRGTSTAIYTSGIVWSGQFIDGITPVLRTNGSSYNNGTKVGRILGLRTGVAEDPNSPDVRIWRIRRDWEKADLRQDAAELNSVGLSNVSDGQIQAVRDQYKTDWSEWPWQKGAPYYERNGRAGYQPHPDAHFDAEDSTYDEPGVADADQVIWYVCNDIGVNQPWACPETGLEMQATIWGYNRTDALGNTIFKRFRLIYKGTVATIPNARIDSMYICQWSDPDLGNYTDDLVGGDTLLSLGYVYNGSRVDASYADFGLAPPASGFDFLQGPLVRGVAGQDRNRNGVDDAVDFAVFDLKRVGPGYINLPMTSFLYWAQGNPIFTDPDFDYPGAKEWEAMLRGLPPLPTPPPYASPILDNLGNVTTYMFAGDPTNTNIPSWLDGNIPGHNGDPRAISGPSDRRLMLSSGPFNMALGDTQELVSAWVGGSGKDRFGSIKVMKFNDASVQLAYNNLFSLPKPPESPRVRVTPGDGEVILEWDADSTAFAKTENTIGFGGYLFEGYNIYQLENASGDLSTAKRLATYDIPNGFTTIRQQSFDENSGEILDLPVRFGLDNGISRFIRISRDEFRSTPLANGQAYYFAVTAYNFLPPTIDPTNPLRTLESTPLVITVVPEKTRPGIRLAYSVGDTIRGIADVVGVNDAVVAPTIYNAAVQYGEDLNRNGRLDTGEDVNGNGVLDPYRYLITFDTSSATLTGFSWNVKNAITGKAVYQTLLDDGTVEHRVSEAGFLLHVAGPRSGLKTVTDGSGKNVLYTDITSGPFTVLSLDSTLNGVCGLGSNANRKYEIRFDGIGSFALRIGGGAARAVRVPFSVWDVGRTPSDTAKKVVAAFKDSNSTPTRWNMTRTGLAQFGTLYRVFEPIIIASAPYPAVNDSQEVGDVRPGHTGNLVINAALSQTNPNSAVWHAFIANLTAGDTLPPAVGTVIRFNKFLAIASGDVKQFTPNLISVGNVGLARQDVQDIKVFPNPYYGLNRAETDRVNRFVTFSHLPDQAIIRIFNLAGILVRTLRKDDPANTNQFLRWNLRNENGLPVASGIYIAYIDMPDIGTTKTLKIAIIQEQQFLRNY